MLVTQEATILAGVFDGFTWIRCEGKGSFANSPVLKGYAEARIAAGEKLIVVDLGACGGMDSTFMGTLAGIAAGLAPGAGSLQVAEPGDRNRRSLEDLGLDFVMSVDPPDAVWRVAIDSVRSALEPVLAGSKPGISQRALEVLEAHRNLSSLNPANAAAFKDVVRSLERETGSSGGGKDGGD